MQAIAFIFLWWLVKNRNECYQPLTFREGGGMLNWTVGKVDLGDIPLGLEEMIERLIKILQNSFWLIHQRKKGNRKMRNKGLDKLKREL